MKPKNEIFTASIDIENDPAWNLEDPIIVAALFRLAKHGFIDGTAAPPFVVHTRGFASIG